MHTTTVMKLSQNGQVSIPAATRARWQTNRVVVVDLGNYLVMRPATADPAGGLLGKYAGRGPSSDAMRREDRVADDERGRHRR